MNITLPPNISPQYKNLFIAKILPPSGLTFEGKDKIINEGHILIRDVSIPGVSHGRVTDNFLTLSYYFRDNQIKFNEIKFTFLLTMEEKNMHAIMVYWLNSILGHLRNDAVHFAKGTTPNEYKGNLVLYLLKADFNFDYIVVLTGAFPMSVDDLAVSYSGGAELMTFGATFSFDFPAMIDPKTFKG